MPQVRLYAVLRPERRSIRLPTRLDDERFRILNLGFASVVYSDSQRALEPTLPNLKRHDDVVSALAAVSVAILPARFGTVVETTEQLRSEIVEQQEKFEAALDLVAGCQQMTIRLPQISRRQRSGKQSSKPARGTRSGTQYLHSRASVTRAGPSWILKTQSPVRALVKAERLEVTPDRVTIYHLIEKGNATQYQRTLGQSGISKKGVRITGPFPPYAFVPGIDRATWTKHDQQKTSRRKTRSARSRAQRRGARNAR